MALSFRAPGKYVQAPGALALPDSYTDVAGRAFTIIDSDGLVRVGDQLKAGLARDCGGPLFKTYDGPCSEAACREMAVEALESGCGFVTGVGGGKMLDIAKAVAHFARLPVAVCPTVASTDAPCSSIAVLYHNDGSFDRYLHLRRNPNLVVVDSSVIAKAPAFLLVAGMGDALSTWFEARACARAGGKNELGGAPGASALALARGCFDTLMDCGVQAKLDVEAGRLSPAVERAIETNILMSGIGFESGGLALAHAFANGLTAVPDVRAMHGFAVAFGLQVQLLLEGASDDLARVRDFCRQVGLPMTLADLGLTDATDDDLRTLATATLACSRNIANCPFEVTEQTLLQAVGSVSDM